MARNILQAVVLFSLVCVSHGFTECAGIKNLVELRKMSGVAVEVKEGAQDHYPGVRNKDLIWFSIGWLEENEFLGKGYLKEYIAKFQPKKGDFGHGLKEVELYGVDQNGQTLFVTRVWVGQISGGVLSKQFGNQTHTCVTLSIDRSLIEHSFIRFWEFVGRGSQWTDVYLGSKPPAPPKPASKASAPQELGVPVIPGIDAQQPSK